MSTAPCGTYAAYQQHKKTGTPPCDECRAANTAYQTAYRAKHTAYLAENRRQNAALQRAKTRVANAHPRELAHVYKQELMRTQPKESTP